MFTAPRVASIFVAPALAASMLFALRPHVAGVAVERAPTSRVAGAALGQRVCHETAGRSQGIVAPYPARVFGARSASAAALATATAGLDTP
jgi:hypothetical protein